LVSAKTRKKGNNIITYTNAIQSLARFCNLFNPEEVKGIIATKYKTTATQHLIVYAYNAYVNFVGKTWIKPTYKPEHKQVFIPNESELQMTINTGNTTSIFFCKFLYETGARCNDAERFE